jgi:hypothetical protein
MIPITDMTMSRERSLDTERPDEEHHPFQPGMIRIALKAQGLEGCLAEEQERPPGSVSKPPSAAQ